MGSHSVDSNASTHRADDHHLLPHHITFARMETCHGYTCPTGCIDRTCVNPGSVLLFSPSCLADITQHDMVEELVVILRLPTSSSSITANGGDLYHCAVVSNFLLLRIVPCADTCRLQGRHRQSWAYFAKSILPNKPISHISIALEGQICTSSKGLDLLRVPCSIRIAGSMCSQQTSKGFPQSACTISLTT